MSDARLNRWMGPLGILIVVVIFVGFGPLSGNSPGQNASGAKVAAYWNSHMTIAWASIYVSALGIALLLVYLTQLRNVLSDAGGGRLWPNAMFFAGIVLVGGVVLTGTFQVVLFLAAHNHQDSVVQFANFFGNNDELPIIFGIAAVTLSAGIAILTNRANPLPKPLGWYSLLVGVVSCAGPLAFFAFLFGFPIWLIALGWVITVKARRASLVEGQGGAARASDLART